MNQCHTCNASSDSIMSSLFGGPKPNTFGNIPSTGFGSTNNNQNAPSGYGTQPLNTAPSLFGANAGSSATGNVGAPNPFGTNATPASNPSPFSQFNNPNPGIPSATAPNGNTFSKVFYNYLVITTEQSEQVE